jgi:hypothetical protein
MSTFSSDTVVGCTRNGFSTFTAVPYDAEGELEMGDDATVIILAR